MDQYSSPKVHIPKTLLRRYGHSLTLHVQWPVFAFVQKLSTSPTQTIQTCHSVVRSVSLGMLFLHEKLYFLLVFIYGPCRNMSRFSTNEPKSCLFIEGV